MNSNLKEILQIAVKELRSCYKDEGILAGNHHFTDYWARDGYFAALGSLEIGDSFIVERMLNLFYKHQRKDGLIPYRIMRGPMLSVKKYLGKPPFYSNPKPTYRLRGIGKEVLDGTTLTLLFTAILGLKNKKNVTKFVLKIKKSLKYLMEKEKDGLLFDGVMAEWNDSVLKWGNLLYSNIIYWYMYDRLSAWTQYFDKKWHKELKRKTESVANSLHKKLWNGKFFADWYDYKRHDYFYPFGNCLAIAWGLTNKREAESILKECQNTVADFTLETNSPKYPKWRINPLQQLVGMGDYQNKSLLWWQPVVSYLTALKKTKKQKLASQIEAKIVSKVFKDKSIYECYERPGSPVKRLLYKSENPFAWSSGMLLWALKKRF